MKIKRIYISGYKNLNNFDSTFTEEKTVIIGQNATGKSNFIEAVVIIFKNIDYNLEPEFNFCIYYEIKGKNIVIRGSLNENSSQRYSAWEIEPAGFISDDSDEVADKIFSNPNAKGSLSLTTLRGDKDNYLPKHVFTYYSGLGNSNRLEEILHKPSKEFALSLVNSDDDSELGDRRFFYVQLHHSHFVLLSFYAFNLEQDIYDFLKSNLNIDNLETILFVLKRPSWRKTKGGDQKFWGSRGIVKSFLNDLYEISTAPLKDVRPHRIDLWRETREDRMILYISDIKKIKDLVSTKKWDNIKFFNILESINASDLYREVRIRIRKNYAGNITFKDLSEGEQQLLTVLGLMRFTQYDESLYLLDEPDTHLNPLWRWQYMEFISKVALKHSTSQVIMTSHDPFTIGSLCKEEVRIFKTDDDGRTISLIPTRHPRGMGVGGILTEIFHLPTTLDIPTQEEIDEERTLRSRIYFEEQISESDRKRLEELTLILDRIGYNSVYKDPLFQKFEMTLTKVKREKGLGLPKTQQEIEEQNKLALDILNDMFKGEEI